MKCSALHRQYSSEPLNSPRPLIPRSWAWSHEILTLSLLGPLLGDAWMLQNQHCAQQLGFTILPYSPSPLWQFNSSSHYAFKNQERQAKNICSANSNNCIYSLIHSLHLILSSLEYHQTSRLTWGPRAWTLCLISPSESSGCVNRA